MKLEYSEVLELFKYGIAALGASCLIFVLPYVLITSGHSVSEKAIGKDSIQFLDYAIYAIVLWFILSHISEILLGLGRFFTDLGEMTQQMSRLKQVLASIIGIAYMVCWSRYYITTFFVTATVLIPAEFVYIKCKGIIKDR